MFLPPNHLQLLWICLINQQGSDMFKCPFFPISLQPLGVVERISQRDRTRQTVVLFFHHLLDIKLKDDLWIQISQYFYKDGSTLSKPQKVSVNEKLRGLLFASLNLVDFILPTFRTSVKPHKLHVATLKDFRADDFPLSDFVEQKKTKGGSEKYYKWVKQKSGPLVSCETGNSQGGQPPYAFHLFQEERKAYVLLHNT